MVIAERIGYRPKVDEESVKQEDRRQMRLYNSVAMPFQISVPREYKIFDKHGHCSFAPETPVFSISVDRQEDRYDMSTKQIANCHHSLAGFETVSIPEKVNIDGKEGWKFDIFRNAAAFPENSMQEIIRTSCVFKDQKGFVWTISLSASSTQLHEKEIGRFEKEILSSFRLVEK